MYMNRDVLKQIIIDQKEMYLDNPLISEYNGWASPSNTVK